MSGQVATPDHSGRRNRQEQRLEIGGRLLGTETWEEREERQEREEGESYAVNETRKHTGAKLGRM